MGIRSRPNFTADADADEIAAIVSSLNASFLPADFHRAERLLLARESNLRREIETLKKENAKLLEDNEFQKLETLGSKDVIVEQKRRIRALESAKSKLEALVRSEYEGWKGLISKLEDDAKKLSGGSGRRSGSGGVEVKVETELCANEIGGVASSARSSVLGHGGVKDSGIQKFASEDTGLIDRHNECDAKETEMLCENNDTHKGAESLGLSGVEVKPRGPKRKLESSLSGSDDETVGGKFKKVKNSNSEMKLSLEPDGSLTNQSIQILDCSGSNVSENQNLPSHRQVNSRQYEEKIMAELKSEHSFNTLVEVSSDSDNEPGASLGSSTSSSSSDSDEEYRLLSDLSQLDDIIPSQSKKGQRSL